MEFNWTKTPKRRRVRNAIRRTYLNYRYPGIHRWRGEEERIGCDDCDEVGHLILKGKVFCPFHVGDRLQALTKVLT